MSASNRSVKTEFRKRIFPFPDNIKYCVLTYICMPPLQTEEKQIAPEILESQRIDWVGIAVKLAVRNDILSLKILEKIYVSPGHPFILDELVKAVIKPVDKRKKMTVWRRVNFLKTLGLLETDSGKPMSIYPVRTIERQNISYLLKLCYGKIFGDIHVQS